ncbi:MAG: flagellar hook-basal body complex protein FliE [Peptostreptococcaceae bacterium]|nr:flagellar hook-basal body complex protein FliE [Peptostreptococcaceae bacterium]
MFIKPMHAVESIGQLDKIGKAQEAEKSGSMFEDVFRQAIENVKQTDKELQMEQYLLASGQSDDLHNLTIASTKAQLSIDLMVQLRNKAMEAYNEMMRINL